MMRNEFYGRHVAAASVAALCIVLSGCGGGSLFNSSGSTGSSVGTRFSQLFGSNSQPAGNPSDASASVNNPADDLTCPPVSVRPGAATYAVGVRGAGATGSDVRYQASVTRTARDCTLSGGQVRARVGIEGRIIVGPAGAPPNTEIPLRIALIQESVPPKTIFTSAYRTNVTIGPQDQNAEFSLVAEDILYPPPQGDAGDKYVFYVGFDPSAAKPERPAKPVKKPKR
jgi:hypothetical protein